MNATVKTSETVTKAKAIAGQVNRYAEGLKNKVATFRTVPGFSKYEVSAGGVLRNRKNQQVQQVPSGKSKYYIFNDKGERRSISIEEIKALMPAEAPKAKAQKAEKVAGERKARTPKAETPTTTRIKELREDKAVNKILSEGGKKHMLCFKLHKQGLTTPEIMALAGCPYNATKRNIWLYESGQKKLSE